MPFHHAARLPPGCFEVEAARKLHLATVLEACSPCYYPAGFGSAPRVLSVWCMQQFCSQLHQQVSKQHALLVFVVLQEHPRMPRTAVRFGRAGSSMRTHANRFTRVKFFPGTLKCTPAQTLCCHGPFRSPILTTPIHTRGAKPRGTPACAGYPGSERYVCAQCMRHARNAAPVDKVQDAAPRRPPAPLHQTLEAVQCAGGDPIQSLFAAPQTCRCGCRCRSPPGASWCISADFEKWRFGCRRLVLLRFSNLLPTRPAEISAPEI